MQELSLIIIIGLIHGTYYLSRRDNILAYMDVAWGLGFVLIALFGYLTEMKTLPKLVLLLLVAGWGLRLAYHCWRRIKMQGEDWRYQEVKNKWGDQWQLESYKKIFLFQGLAMFFISQPIQLGMTGLWDSFGKNQILGILIIVTGLAIEILADYQLKEFKSQHPNTLYTGGLWRFCRFPNYFGEIVVWVGFYIYILNFWSFWTIISPIILTYSLFKITGIPLIERRLSRYENYHAYAQKTPVMWPFSWKLLKNWKTNLR